MKRYKEFYLETLENPEIFYIVKNPKNYTKLSNILFIALDPVGYPIKGICKGADLENIDNILYFKEIIASNNLSLNLPEIDKNFIKDYLNYLKLGIQICTIKLETDSNDSLKIFNNKLIWA